MDVDIRECRAGEPLAAMPRFQFEPRPLGVRTTAGPLGATRQAHSPSWPRVSPRSAAWSDSAPLPILHVASSAGSRQAFRFRSRYGENFSRFLRSQGNAASIEYVADIAELEIACNRARYAADIRPLDAKVLSSLRAHSSADCGSRCIRRLPSPIAFPDRHGLGAQPIRWRLRHDRAMASRRGPGGAAVRRGRSPASAAGRPHLHRRAVGKGRQSPRQSRQALPPRPSLTVTATSPS